MCLNFKARASDRYDSSTRIVSRAFVRPPLQAKAARSVRLIGGVSEAVAGEAVRAVFERCYRDLEPVGRRCYSREQGRLALGEEDWRARGGQGTGRGAV